MLGFPDGSDGKAPACNAEYPGSITGSGRSPEEGNGNPLQYSCLENSTDSGAWCATVHGFEKSGIQLSTAQHSVSQELCLSAQSPLKKKKGKKRIGWYYHPYFFILGN